MCQGKGGDPVLKPRRIANPPQLEIREMRQSLKKVPGELGFVFGNGCKRLIQAFPAGKVGRETADIGQIIYGRFDTGDTFVILRPGHPLSRQRVGSRSQFLRQEWFQEIPSSPEGTDMRPEELVGGAGQEITLQL